MWWEVLFVVSLVVVFVVVLGYWIWKWFVVFVLCVIYCNCLISLGIVWVGMDFKGNFGELLIGFYFVFKGWW